MFFFPFISILTVWILWLTRFLGNGSLENLKIILWPTSSMEFKYYRIYFKKQLIVKTIFKHIGRRESSIMNAASLTLRSLLTPATAICTFSPPDHTTPPSLSYWEVIPSSWSFCKHLSQYLPLKNKDSTRALLLIWEIQNIVRQSSSHFKMNN